jgi:hypothetical protein
VWNEKGRFKIGSLLRVLPGKFVDEPDLNVLICQPELYCVFYPIYQLAPRGFASYVGTYPVPSRFNTQPLLRFPKQYHFGEQKVSIASWTLWDGVTEQVFSPLPKKYWSVPIVELLTGNGLAAAIEAGWTPSDALD